MIYKVFEAFAPSGTELPDRSLGLYAGIPALIKEWAAENSPWEPDTIQLIERTVYDVNQQSLDELKGAKQGLEEAKQRVKRALTP